MDTIIEAVRTHVPDDDTRFLIYEPIFAAFEQEDWDTQRECLGIDPAFDRLIPDEDEGDLEDEMDAEDEMDEDDEDLDDDDDFEDDDDDMDDDDLDDDDEG